MLLNICLFTASHIILTLLKCANSFAEWLNGECHKKVTICHVLCSSLSAYNPPSSHPLLLAANEVCFPFSLLTTVHH